MVQPPSRSESGVEKRANPFLTAIIVVEGVLVLLALLAPFVYEHRYSNRVFPGVSALGVNLGGKTQDEVRVALSRPIAEREGQALALTYGERRWTPSAAELGLSYDLEATLAQAMAIGREWGLVDNTRTRLALLRTPYAVEAAVKVDRVRSLDYLNRLARDIDTTMQNASLQIENLQVVTTTARTGYRLDVEASSARVVQALASGTVVEVPLQVAVLPPLVLDQGIAEARSLVQKLISAPITVTFSGRDWVLADGVAAAQNVERSWTIDRQQLANAITLDQRKSGDQVTVTARFDSEKFGGVFTAIAKELNRKAQDARFDYNVKTGRLTPAQISQEGRSVDVAESVKRLAAAASSDNHTVALAVTITKPALAVDQASKMGVREKVGEGVTTYVGSSEARAHNIQLAASKMDNATIAPGATFSLLAALGPITADAGYQEGFAIVGESTVQDVGGGVCQVATTVFRAAFYAGLPIVERNQHRYLIPRYFIKGGPHGLDAAIYDPGRDLQFKNTTGNYLIIKADASDPANFTVVLYGTKPGWVVTMEEPVIKPGKEPGPRLADIEDPAKPVGYKVLAQAAVAGESVSITRVVKQGNTVIARDVFTTNYQPASEQWIVGTKK